MIIKKYLFETHSSGAIESHVTIKTKDSTSVKQRTDNSFFFRSMDIVVVNKRKWWPFLFSLEFRIIIFFVSKWVLDT